MAKAILDKILKEAQALTHDEQKQLKEAIDQLLMAHQSATVEGRLQQQLFEAGLLSEIKPPVSDLPPYEDRAPVEIKGKPLSEVIIEERR